jgi:hypothetical protein
MGIFQNACPRVIDETAINTKNEIIPYIALQLSHLSNDVH